MTGPETEAAGIVDGALAPSAKLRASALSDSELMGELCARLDESALEELSRRHRPRAERLARVMLGTPEQAEDAVQECFLRLVRARSSYRPGAAFAPWFYSLLRNVCRDELRRRASAAEARPQPYPRTAEDPARVVLERESVGTLREALGRLPEADREILAMRIHGGLPFEEIAAAAGISTECARKRAQRALERLRRDLV